MGVVLNLSTRSRYGMRMLYELAVVYGKVNLSLKEISIRQSISDKYLGQIAIPLKSAGLIRAERGSFGGYTLTRAPGEISIAEVVSVLDGGLELLDCLKEGNGCSQLKKCPSFYIWDELSTIIKDYLESISLLDMVKRFQTEAGNWNYSI